jgi:putative transposase
MNRLHAHTPRLRSWDYGSGGAYFVTFRVQCSLAPLGSVSEGTVTLTPSGSIVDACWKALQDDFPVTLDAQVIMPDHVHAILILDGSEPLLTGENAGFRPLMSQRATTLGKVIRSWKARATLEIRRGSDPNFAWQSRYFDRVIRSQRELDRIRAYIHDNPARWWARKGG